ncbi:unnamed protein product [Peniophora sp. CBMAI 1063]|nr:unnamed protein product [Peniophora sp. CBMAI 1063]
MNLSSYSFLAHERNALVSDEFWRTQYCFLFSRGYELHPSLAPAAGDDISNPITELGLIDATRVADGLAVSIRSTTARAVAAHVHAATHARAPWDHICNHIAPVVDVLSSSEAGGPDRACVFVVMPRLVKPSAHIRTVSDVTDFVAQSLAALVTLHEDPVGMALGGCALNDFGVHCEPDLEGQVNIRYCITNFARAVHLGDNAGPSINTDRRVAYAADVAALGSMLTTDFAERYTNVSFLAPLITETDLKFGKPAIRLCSFWRQTTTQNPLYSLLPRPRVRRLRGRDEALVHRILA